MEPLKWKMRISVLWVILAVGFSVYMVFRFMEPGFIEGILSGIFGNNRVRITGGYLSCLAIFWFIPFIMAFLSLKLKDSVNRWTNFVLGVFLAVAFICGLVQSMNNGHSAVILANECIGFMAAALIGWYAWKWPVQEA
jgi:hypothetical protein